MANALLIVDVQNFYLNHIPTDLPDRIAKHHKALQYDVVAFSVFKNQPDSNFVKSLKWDKCYTAEDAQLPREFDSLASEDNVFTRAAYSAFKTTDLDAYLRKNEVDRLIICGVDSDACVLATAFEAFDLGYHVKVNFDLSYSSNDFQKASQSIVEKNILSRD